ncbi:MAG TPA: hypothetical protein VGI64_03360 [Streptosporangiaceae bacterium]|jgi:hypothetical protein
MMSVAASGLVIVFLALGCLLGWHANRAHAAHGDVKTTKGRLPGYRQTRLRSGIISIALIIVLLLVLANLF